MSAGYNGDHSWVSAAMRLVASFRAWRWRRVARRHSFSGLSDRMLADIGVRRADVFGATVGAVSLAGSAASAEGMRTDAEVYALPRRRAATAVSSDLSAAA